MDIFIDQISRMVYEQKKILENYTIERDAIDSTNSIAKDENLSCCRNHGSYVYYRARRDKSGKYVRKSLTKDQAILNALARKEYLRAAINALKHNINVLETASGDYKDLDLESLIPGMQSAYRNLPEECFFANEAVKADLLSADNEGRFRRHREWANEPYEKSDYMPEHRRFMTSGGFKVRSKSEQLIAEQLLSCGVPFRYEQVVHIDGLSYSADFTFRDRDLKPFYWEHAGMMNDPRYLNRHCRKMDSFESIGIVPWKNLIITYDNDGAVNIPMIKSIIENDVIPRM